MHTQQFSVPESLNDPDRLALEALLCQADAFINDPKNSKGVYIIKADIRDYAAKLLTSFIFLINRGLYLEDKGEPTLLMHRSYCGKLIRDVKMWLNGHYKESTCWKGCLCGRIEDAARSLAKRAKTRPQSLAFEFEIGTSAYAHSINTGTAGAIIVAFAPKK